MGRKTLPRRPELSGSALNRAERPGTREATAYCLLPTALPLLYCLLPTRPGQDLVDDDTRGSALRLQAIRTRPGRSATNRASGPGGHRHSGPRRSRGRRRRTGRSSGQPRRAKRQRRRAVPSWTPPGPSVRSPERPRRDDGSGPGPAGRHCRRSTRRPRRNRGSRRPCHASVPRRSRRRNRAPRRSGRAPRHHEPAAAAGCDRPDRCATRWQREPRPSTAPTRRQGINGTRNRPASVYGQARRRPRVRRGINPASRRRGRRNACPQPIKITPVPREAQRFAATTAAGERPRVVATSTSGPVIWSGIRWR